MKSVALIRGAVAALCLVCAWAGLVHAASYAVVDRLPIGGDGGWDYPSVDSASGLLYLSRATHVVIVDMTTRKIAGEFADTPGVHGIAIAADLQRAYVSAGKANQVKVFDLGTRQLLASVVVGLKPDAILYEPATRQVFAFNGEGSSASVIDPSTNQVTATIALGGDPEFGAADGKGWVFVNLEDKNELAALDAKTHSLVAHYPLPACERPTGLALDATHRRSFSVCGNAIMSILDIDTGRAVATVPIGRAVDGVQFDPDSGNAFSANGEGTLTVVHESNPDHFAVSQTLTTAAGARTIALDSKLHALFLPTALFDADKTAPSTPHARPPILPGSFFVVKIMSVAPSQAP